MPYGLINNGLRCSDVSENGDEVRSRIVFVGGMAPSTTRDAVIAFFRKHGNVVDATLFAPRARAPSHGFVHFDSEASAAQVCSCGGMLQFRGKMVEVRRAVPASQTGAILPAKGKGPFQGKGDGKRAPSPMGDGRAVREELLKAREARREQTSSSSSSSSYRKKRKRRKSESRAKRRKRRSSCSSSCSAEKKVDAAALQENPITTSPEVQQAQHEAYEKLVALKSVENKDERMKEWRALLREWHPDKNPDRAEVATAVFQFLQKSRSVLDSK